MLFRIVNRAYSEKFYCGHSKIESIPFFIFTYANYTSIWHNYLVNYGYYTCYYLIEQDLWCRASYNFIFSEIVKEKFDESNKNRFV